MRHLPCIITTHMKATCKLVCCIAAAVAFAAVFHSCSKNNGKPALTHEEKNGVYYWKTVFSPDAQDNNFLLKHNIRRIYLRMFDVTVDIDDNDGRRIPIPNATVRISESAYKELKSKNIEFVPVVYITLDALKCGQECGIGDLAKKIVERVKNMCSYNELSHIEGLQLDCDWTPTTEKSFFALCDSVKAELPLKLSATIRLHQLSRPAPPVDYGVLMVYNTGNFSDPDAANSILDEKDVKPYLKHIGKYPLHLDVAYPTYSWQLLFRSRRFVGLLNGVEVGDTAKFMPKAANAYVAKKDMVYRETIIYKGDMIRTEQSDFRTISRVKSLIEAQMKGKPHSSILYHFDLKNLKKYSDDETQSLFGNAPGK